MFCLALVRVVYSLCALAFHVIIFLFYFIFIVIIIFYFSLICFPADECVVCARTFACRLVVCVCVCVCVCRRVVCASERCVSPRRARWRCVLKFVLSYFILRFLIFVCFFFRYFFNLFCIHNDMCVCVCVACACARVRYDIYILCHERTRMT